MLYQPVELLNSEKIKSVIELDNLQRLSQLEILDTIDSTNSYLLRLIKSNVSSGRVCFAEQQTQGRGRRGRSWFSPHAKSIYCSLLWRFKEVQQDISGLSIAVAVMILNSLKKYGITEGIQLKWPNDILFAGRKLAGILLECSGTHVVIGIGLNLCLPQREDHWIDVMQITGELPKRNYLAGLLLNELLEKLPLYQANGLKEFVSEWRKYDFFTGKNITVHLPEKSVSGVMYGINDAGELLLQDQENRLRNFRYGEITVREM